MSRIAIILGAGATKGSGYKLKLPDRKIDIPVDKDFLKVVFENKIHNMCLQKSSGELLYDSFMSLMREFRIIENEKVISNLGLEETWNTVVLNNKFVQQNLIQLDVKELREEWKEQSESPQVKLIKRADFFLRLLVQQVYGMIDYEEINHYDSSFNKLFTQLGLTKRSKEISFLTFNYDLCLENSLWNFMKKTQYFYYPNFEDNYILDQFKQYPIYKLHGSLNWWHGFDGYIRLKKENILRPNLVNAYFQEGSFDSWEKYQPAIIPMDFLKEEFYDEKGQARLHRHYMNLWALAGRDLEESEKIIVIGYSFPPADPHVRWLIRASQCNLFNKSNEFKPKTVYFITKYDEETNKTISILKVLFRQNPVVCDKGFENCFEDFKTWNI